MTNIWVLSICIWLMLVAILVNSFRVIGLLEKGLTTNTLLAAYFKAMAHRIMELLLRLGVEKEFAITGGQSKNIGTVRRIERELGFEALKWSEVDPQLAGGIGAALFAKALVEKSRK